MKAPIVKLFGLVIVLFGVLIGFTSYWSVFAAESLRDNPANHRTQLQEQRIKRGTIRTQDGQLIAGSTRGRGGVYTRRYPQHDLFGHPVGYAFTNIGHSGLESKYNDALTGRRTELLSVFDSLLNKKRTGQDLETTLNAKAQRVAQAALNASPSGKGAVVAMDVKTGAVRAMVSSPGFDPNDLDNGRTFQKLATDNANAPLVNRATQSLYPPGSTFKAVTAAAAVDSGRYTPDSQISGKNGKLISGVPLQNFSGEDFGLISLTDALTHSVNTVFGEIGEKLGKSTMRKYMRRFGFDSQPPIDLPSTQLAASGERLKGKILSPTSRFVDVGRMAIGQDKLLVTPLQMASVAQTIGNGGVRMEPYLVAKGFDADGRTTIDHQPQEAERVMTQGSAAAVTNMMKQVVKEGTGTAAALSGVELAGKTGTAELNNNGLNDLWFIGFTGDHAVAVVVERVQGGQGGTVAAPIAKQVLGALGD
jgi:peptidoglycan glycosyltransferase